MSTRKIGTNQRRRNIRCSWTSRSNCEGCEGCSDTLFVRPSRRSRMLHGADQTFAMTITTHDRVMLSLEHLEGRILAIPPKADVEALSSQAQIAQRDVSHPVRQCRIDIQFAARCILPNSQHRLQQHE